MVEIMKKIIACWMVLVMFCFEGCFFNISRQTFDNHENILLSAIETRDREKLKSILSKDALESADLEDGMDYFFGLLENKEIVNIQKLGLGTHDRFDSGKHEKWIGRSYNIVTNDGEYYLYIIYWQVNKNRCILGMNYIKMTPRIVGDEEYIKSSEYQRSGIYNPQWDEELKSKS